jgi:hypothetical protein
MMLNTGWVVTLGGHWTPPTELLESKQEDPEGVKKHHAETEFKAYNDVYALNLAGGARKWRTLETAAPFPARDDAAAGLSVTGALVIFAGGTIYGGGGYLHDVWRLQNFGETYKLAASSAHSDEL